MSHPLSSKKILLTGAAGFVGSYLLRRLIEKNCHVTILLKRDTKPWRIADLLTHPHIKIEYGDLFNAAVIQSVVRKVQPDVIYHLAARGAYSTQDDAIDIFQTDILGTLNLFHACQQVPYELFVNTGSSSEYGAKKSPMREKDVLEPNSYYAIAKAAATHLAAFLASSTHKPIVTLRLFSVYGPYEAPSRLFPTLLKSLAIGTPMRIVPGDTARDFVYVDDVTELFMDFKHLRLGIGECFNVGTGKQSTIHDVITAAEKVTGRTLHIAAQPMPSRSWDTSHWVADMKKTKVRLQWQPRYSLKAGLTDMWQWWQAHGQLYE